MTTTQDALNRMTADISKRKGDKDATLTPVGIEKGGPLDGRHPGAPFPYDDAQTVHGAIRQGLRVVDEAAQHLGHVRTGLVQLAALYGADSDVPAPYATLVSEAVASRRDSEKAHEEWLEEWRAKQQDAQAQAFGQPTLLDEAKRIFGDDLVVPVPVTTEGGWACPDHALEDVVALTSRKGRKYRACRVASCRQFEKENE